jgi:myo-inositol-1(or 4)-monophosphatase
MHIHTIENVLEHVVTAGEMALDAQRQMRYEQRTYKADGSVLTEIDAQVEEYLHERIARAYPHANILGEETVRSFDPRKGHTFVIDPIDGTDVYSQGMPGWCVSLGLLNQALRPIAGIVFSPRWELLLFADVGAPATVNGEQIRPSRPIDPLSNRTNVMAYSRIHTQVDWSRYPGKIRSIGSAALHLCFPLIYPGVFAAVEGRGGHIWDIAGAHAINLSHGFAVEYLGGDEIDYATMVDGSPAGDNVLGGSKQAIQVLRDVLRR